MCDLTQMEVKMIPKAETIAAGVAATALLIAGDYVSKYYKNVGLAMQLCSFIPAGYAIYTLLTGEAFILPPELCTQTFKIVDEEGNAVQYAKVSAYGVGSCITNEKGECSLILMTGKKYSINVIKEGYTCSVCPKEITACTSTPLKIELNKTPDLIIFNSLDIKTVPMV